MCFAPGIVKRMGTVEDFDTEIQRLIQSYLDGMAQSVSQAQKSAELATSKAQESSTSASNAKTSETNAKTSETNASNSATKARNSETNAKASETKAKASETSASTSASNAKASETNSKTSETNAKKSETNASTSAANAKNSETNAKASATSASTFASNAKTSETKAKASETNAKTSETNSAKSESEAQKYAEQVKEISESFSGALRPLGTINFADLPSTADANSGDMYNITDQFTTTTDFKEGAGNIIPAGSNVYLTVDRYWDVLAGTPVTGVKGAKEAYYRRGNVNITPANIGAVAEGGNISDTTVTFAATTTRANLVSGEKVSVGFGKIKKWFADLKSFAFKDLVNNLTTSTTGSALDASQGKILNDKYDELNRSLDIDYYTSTIPTNYVTFSGSIALESSNAFYLEVYKIGKLVYFVIRCKIANSNDGAWRVKINKYPMKQTTCHAFSAFKGTGSYVPCYSDSNGYIVNQGGTGKYTIVMSGVYVTA